MKNLATVSCGIGEFSGIMKADLNRHNVPQRFPFQQALQQALRQCLQIIKDTIKGRYCKMITEKHYQVHKNSEKKLQFFLYTLFLSCSIQFAELLIIEIRQWQFSVFFWDVYRIGKFNELYWDTRFKSFGPALMVLKKSMCCWTWICSRERSSILCVERWLILWRDNRMETNEVETE